MTIDLRQSPGNNLTAGNSKSFSKPMKQENAVDQAIVRDLRKGRGGGNYGEEGREGIKLCLTLTIPFERSPHIPEAITFVGSLL